MAVMTKLMAHNASTASLGTELPTSTFVQPPDFAVYGLAARVLLRPDAFRLRKFQVQRASEIAELSVYRDHPTITTHHTSATF